MARFTPVHRSLPARLKQLTLAAAAALALVLAPVASAATPPLVDIGTLGGSYSYPNLVNNSGQVVGTSSLPGDTEYRPFFWDSTSGIQALPTSGSLINYPAALNDSGLVAGSFYDNNTGVNRIYVWSAATGLTDLSSSPGGVLLLNNAGQVAGNTYIAAGNFHAFIWDAAGGLRDLGTLGGLNSSVQGMNASGQVFGSADTSVNTSVPFIWDAANGMREIPLTGMDSGSAYATLINDAGVVAGVGRVSGASVVWVWDAVNGTTLYANPATGPFAAYAQPSPRAVTPGRQVLVTIGSPFDGYSAYVMDPVNGTQRLLLPGASADGWGQVHVSRVNQAGQVVGSANSATGESHAFLWDAAHGMQDLGTLPGGDNSSATGINGVGQITGYAATATGEQHAFLWDAANGMQDLGTLTGSESFGDLISNGGLAGTYYNGSGWRTFFAPLSNATGAPDLQVLTLNTTNNKAPQGQKVTVTAVVKNTGNAAAGASTTVIMDGTTVLATVATPALGAGDSVTLTLDLRTAAQNGTHVLSVSADTANAVTESDEANNTKTLTVNIKGNQVR